MELSRRRLIISAAAWAAKTRVSFASSSGAGSSKPSVLSKIPRKSDVVFSARFARPNSVDAMISFGATRCEWVYSDDPKFIGSLKSVVPHVGLTMNSEVAGNESDRAAQDISGNTLVAPWQKGMGIFRGSSARSAERQAVFGRAQHLISLGSNSIQYDDPDFEFGTYQFAGGDFSTEAIQGFSIYVKTDPHLGINDKSTLQRNNWNIATWVKSKDEHPDLDWPAFKRRFGADPIWISWGRYQKATVGAFLVSFRASLQSAGGTIPLSFNVPNPLPLYDRLFMIAVSDYLISEVNTQNNPALLAAYCLTCDAMAKPLVASLAPKAAPDTRWQIALTYALGGNALVPWDVYVPPGPLGGQSPRYFGSVDDFGDIYQFVRKNPALFDGWKLSSDVAIVIDPNSADKDTVVELVNSCLLLGVACRFVIAGDGESQSIFGREQFSNVTPKIAIPLGVSVDFVKQLFPNVAIASVGSIGDVVDGEDLFQIKVPPGILAFGRENSAGDLLIHIINVSGSDALPASFEVCFGAGFNLGSAKTAQVFAPKGVSGRGKATIDAGNERGTLKISLPQSTSGWTIVYISV